MNRYLTNLLKYRPLNKWALYLHFQNSFSLIFYFCVSHICTIWSGAEGVVLYNEYLTNYWPISNGQMNDQVGNADMIQGASTTFVADRFGNPNSALGLNGGYTQVPAGFYFNSLKFTITAWIYPQSLDAYATLLDFGNGPSTNSIIITLSNGGFTNSPVLTICPNNPYFVSCQICTSYLPLQLGVWSFLAATYDGKYMRIYTNGYLQYSFYILNLVFNSIIRKYNYFGMRNVANSPGHSYSYIDDLKFYNTSLTFSELYNVMTYVEPATEVSTDMTTDITTDITTDMTTDMTTSSTSTRNTH